MLGEHNAPESGSTLTSDVLWSWALRESPRTAPCAEEPMYVRAFKDVLKRLLTNPWCDKTLNEQVMRRSQMACIGGPT